MSECQLLCCFGCVASAVLLCATTVDGENVALLNAGTGGFMLTF